MIVIFLFICYNVIIMRVCPEITPSDLITFQDPFVIMMVGAPFSGKTQVASELSNLLNIEIISKKSVGMATSPSHELNKRPLGFYVLDALQEGRSVIHDAINANNKNRRRWCAEYRNVGAEVIGIHTMAPEPLILGRNRRLGEPFATPIITSILANIERHPVGRDDGLTAFIQLNTSDRFKKAS